MIAYPVGPLFALLVVAFLVLFFFYWRSGWIWDQAVALVRWFKPPAKLNRWKLLVTGVLFLVIAGGFYNMVNAQNAEQLHKLECGRAGGRDDVRRVLFAFADLPEMFGESPGVLAYEDSRRLIVDAILAPIIVADCPADS